MMSKKPISRFIGHIGGASIVEFTLLFPIIISLAFGVSEFGRIIQHHHIIKKATRDSARFLARVQVGPQVTCPPTSAAWTTAVTNAKNLALKGSLSPSAANQISYWTDPNTVSVTINCLDNSGGAYYGQAYIPTVTVTAAVQYQDVGMISLFGLNAPTFSISHQEMMFGE